MPRTTIDFGIDLGTTNSTIAVVADNGAQVIPNNLNSGITPSAVWEDKHGNLRVGFNAKERALVTDHKNGDVEFKLRMGLGAQGVKTFARTGRKLLPEQLSAEVLKSLRTDVKTNMGEELTTAVICVPAAFETPSTTATQEAARLAGLVDCPLIQEPVAASLSYGFQTKKENVYWLVYDFGGGTFDAALMRVGDGMIRVHNHKGNPDLGGKLIDWDIVTKIVVPKLLAADFKLPDFNRSNSRWDGPLRKLKWLAEIAKIEVCRTEGPVEIDIEDLCQDADGKTVELSISLTPEDVQKASAPHIAESIRLCVETLQEKGMTGKQLDCVLMVGGTTLSPWLRLAVKDALKCPLEYGIDPITVVARGAAIFASTIKRRPPEPDTLAIGTWRATIDGETVGPPDPKIGGRVHAPKNKTADGCTIEFVDAKTRWSSGQVRLDASGGFVTQLHAQENRRHEFRIQLRNQQGAILPVSPEQHNYTPGVEPGPAPLNATIGVGLRNGSVGAFVRKGESLPAKGRLTVNTTVALRPGNGDDVVRIPLLEGDHALAKRNRLIGEMLICGKDVERNLPEGSEVDLELKIDASMGVHFEGFVTLLEKEIKLPIIYTNEMTVAPLSLLRKAFEAEKERLKTLRTAAISMRDAQIEEALKQIDEEGILAKCEDLLLAAATDIESQKHLDRVLLGLQAKLDDVEGRMEWPKTVHEAREAKAETKKAVDSKFATGQDKEVYDQLIEDLDTAIDVRDPALVKNCARDFHRLRANITDRDPGEHVGMFLALRQERKRLTDQSLADQLIPQGDRAMEKGDLEGLKAVTLQLIRLWPDLQPPPPPKGVNIGDIEVRDQRF